MNLSENDREYIDHRLNLTKKDQQSQMFIIMMNFVVFFLIILTSKDAIRALITASTLIILFTLPIYASVRNILTTFPHRHRVIILRAKEGNGEEFCRKTFRRYRWSKTIISSGDTRYTIFAFRKEADAAAFKLFCL